MTLAKAAEIGSMPSRRELPMCLSPSLPTSSYPGLLSEFVATLFPEKYPIAFLSQSKDEYGEFAIKTFSLPLFIRNFKIENMKPHIK